MRRFLPSGPLARWFLLTSSVVLLAGSAQANCLVASLPAAPNCCCNPRAFHSGYSYVVTPGCEASDCSDLQTTVTNDLVGIFWALGEGNPSPNVGIDSGTWPALEEYGWLYTYPGWPSSIQSTWAADPRIDTCIDFAWPPPACMIILFMDRAQPSGSGVFALLADEANNLGHYDFTQPGNITLASVPDVVITASQRGNSLDRVYVAIPGLSRSDLAASLYLDPACDGGEREPAIAGYRIYAQSTTDGGSPQAPIEHWVPVSEQLELDNAGGIHLLDCEADATVYLAFGLEFDSGFSSAYLSTNGPRVACGPNLAEPPAPGRELRRKWPRSR